ncbi:succinate dehydrogenase/fumarate reductase iron-sulfur subunit [Bacteriovoracaceae bacterium]|nr:succinate dehydrogenase/fumarate reductase iron-sulfur subunit [Bacteriovoracaceae bacterium]|tara:strand:- start:220255 stop:221022 length:768 start_codon:yes stop_codon:yes gene_type:complete
MSNEKLLSLNLKIWRQKGNKEKGEMVDYRLEGVSTDSSFLEMLDLLNEQLVEKGDDPVAFDHDCREGICGMCSLMINGQAHGPEKETTTCQLHMRKFEDGDTIVIEPWRAKAFPVLKDLMVDRGALDDIMAAGGYVNVNTGNAPDANEILIGKESADLAMDAAACIGCAACVASCKNASAMLFTSAKISQLALLPQGQVEREQRVINMVEKMDELGFGNCTNEAECEASCPKGIDISNIARMNREYIKAITKTRS